MKRIGKISTVWILFLILLVSMAFIVITGETVIRAASDELRVRALETVQKEIGYISDSLYSQLTAIQLQNTEILNNESVLALAMRSAILDPYETVSYKNAIMKLMRAKLSQINLTASEQLYIPTERTLITTQKAVQATEKEIQTLLDIVTAFPTGLYYTEDEMGFWSASPLVYDAASAANSRIMLTGIRRSSLRELLQKYASQPSDCQLLLTLGNQVLACSHDTVWDEAVYGGTGEEVRTVQSGGSPYYVIRAKHAFSDLSIIAILPVDNVMSNMYRLQRLMKTLEFACLLITMLAAAAYYRIVCIPIKRISAKMQQIGDGDLSVRMEPEKTAELEDVRLTFNSMAERLHQLIDREYTSRLLAASAEKKALQYQISPHFLYNTYFQLRNLILLEENKQAGRLADLMGSFLRYIVHQDDTSAALGEEMAHARNYAEIQSMRFAGRIRVIYDYDETDESWKRIVVPRLLVQPLIENAFVHGLKNKEEGGVIRLSVRREADTVFIRVEDNGEGLSDEGLERLKRSVLGGEAVENEAIALVNIQRRLQLHFGPQSRLEFSRSDMGGLNVTVRIVPGEEEG